MRAPLIAPPLPPVAGLPLVGAAVPFLRNPTRFLADLRARHGDAFLVELLGFRLFFVFSLEGLCSLYELPEEAASFTAATRTLIGLKLPRGARWRGRRSRAWWRTGGGTMRRHGREGPECEGRPEAIADHWCWGRPVTSD